VAKNGLMNLQEHRKMGYGLGWAKTFFPQMYYWDKPELHL
jgi:hypothetical protein